jgi:hypothetical protein
MKFGVMRSQQSRCDFRPEITELYMNSRACRSQLYLNCRMACLGDCELMAAVGREKQQKLIYQKS